MGDAQRIISFKYSFRFFSFFRCFTFGFVISAKLVRPKRSESQGQTNMTCCCAMVHRMRALDRSLSIYLEKNAQAAQMMVCMLCRKTFSFFGGCSNAYKNAQRRIDRLDSQWRVGFSKRSNGQFCIQHSTKSVVSHYLWPHGGVRPADQRTAA